MIPIKFTQIIDPKCIGNILSFLDQQSNSRIIKTMGLIDPTIRKLWVTGNLYARMNKIDPNLEDPRLFSLIMKVANTFNTIIFDRIKTLNFIDQEFTFDELQNLITLCPNVEHLTIRGCECLTDEMILLLTHSYKNLKTIDLTGSTWISNRTFVVIANYCRLLEAVILSICLEANDFTIELFVRNCPRLKFIDLSYCPKMTNKSLLEIAKCKGLEEVDCSFCDGIDADGIVQLIQGVPSIRKINITDCEQIQGEYRNEIMTTHPNIKVIC